MLNTIGHRECEKALEIGRVFSPKEALKIGLVDELVNSADLISRAEEQMKKWCKIPSNFLFILSFVAYKRGFRVF
jgi:3,2-trans-enoyl-CoA isomerase